MFALNERKDLPFKRSTIVTERKRNRRNFDKFDYLESASSFKRRRSKTTESLCKGLQFDVTALQDNSALYPRDHEFEFLNDTRFFNADSFITSRNNLPSNSCSKIFKTEQDSFSVHQITTPTQECSRALQSKMSLGNINSMCSLRGTYSEDSVFDFKRTSINTMSVQSSKMEEDGHEVGSDAVRMIRQEGSISTYKRRPSSLSIGISSTNTSPEYPMVCRSSHKKKFNWNTI
mmetsp:Transcript_19213/g.47092  ORF Transcript_19213/g.47092 Transcript_19213/m.47092 type:complete len:232 (+) Transcript_19213:294-989(+)